jgi:hypothetical protein
MQENLANRATNSMPGTDHHCRSDNGTVLMWHRGDFAAFIVNPGRISVDRTG